MASHIVLIGYGESGRVLLRALQFDPRRTRPTVIDVDPAKVEQARKDGADAVLGFGWRLATLEAAGVPDAAHVVVAVSDDALALRITWVIAPYGVSAHAATLAALACGLGGALALGWGTHAGCLLGVALLHTWYLLDHVDGQLARLQGVASLDGTDWLSPTAQQVAEAVS